MNQEQKSFQERVKKHGFYIAFRGLDKTPAVKKPKEKKAK
jgi:hypothetical protein